MDAPNIPPLPVQFLQDDFNFLSHFRFTLEEIAWMAEHLGLPEVIISLSGKERVSRFEGLCIVLHRLAWPNRLKESNILFDMPLSSLSTLFNHIAVDIHRRWKHLLLWDHVRLTPEFLVGCMDNVLLKGGLLQETFAFIDGTCMRICRPGVNQQEFYSGHKRMHCLKYQAISTPDGIIVHLGGPFAGRHNDAGILIRSSIRHYLSEHAHCPAGRRLVVYGDEGYGQSPEVQAAFRGNILTPEQEARNVSMRRPRLSAEWAFGFVSNNFGLLNYYQKLRLGLSPVGHYYPVAVLFCNLLRCFGRDSTTQSYFEKAPPGPEEYLTPRAIWDATRVVHNEPGYFDHI